MPGQRPRHLLGEAVRPMLIAIISDTHMPRGERKLPAECVSRIRSADLLLHLGDISTVAVLGQLERLGPPLRAIHGNVEEPALFERLPSELELELDGVRLAMTHDAGPAVGRLPRLLRRFPGTDAVLFGHSHLPLLEAGEHFQIFNAGSPTERRRAATCTMGMAHIVGGRISFDHIALGPG